MKTMKKPLVNMILLVIVVFLITACSSKDEKTPLDSSETANPSDSSETSKSSDSSETSKSEDSSETSKPSNADPDTYPKKVGLKTEGEMAAVKESFTDSDLDEIIFIDDEDIKKEITKYLADIQSQAIDYEKDPSSGGFLFRIHLYRNGVEEIYGISHATNGAGYSYSNNFQSIDADTEYLLDENVFLILLDLFNIE